MSFLHLLENDSILALYAKRRNKSKKPLERPEIKQDRTINQAHIDQSRIELLRASEETKRQSRLDKIAALDAQIEKDQSSQFAAFSNLLRKTDIKKKPKNESMDNLYYKLIETIAEELTTGAIATVAQPMGTVKPNREPEEQTTQTVPPPSFKENQKVMKSIKKTIPKKIESKPKDKSLKEDADFQELIQQWLKKKEENKEMSDQTDIKQNDQEGTE